MRLLPTGELELYCGHSRRLARLSLTLPMIIAALALVLVADGYVLAAPAPLAAAVGLARYLRAADPAGMTLRGASGCWYDAAQRPISMRCGARLERVLWLDFRSADGTRRPLLLFSDALSDREWRLLRRALTLATDP